MGSVVNTSCRHRKPCPVTSLSDQPVRQHYAYTTHGSCMILHSVVSGCFWVQRLPSWRLTAESFPYSIVKCILACACVCDNFDGTWSELCLVMHTSVAEPRVYFRSSPLSNLAQAVFRTSNAMSAMTICSTVPPFCFTCTCKAHKCLCCNERSKKKKKKECWHCFIAQTEDVGLLMKCCPEIPVSVEGVVPRKCQLF